MRELKRHSSIIDPQKHIVMVSECGPLILLWVGDLLRMRTACRQGGFKLKRATMFHLIALYLYTAISVQHPQLMT